MKTYRIEVPKPAPSKADGSQVRLYEHGEIVKAKAGWQQDAMDRFVQNGWATELKVDSPSETKRARNSDGTLKGDDPTTPDVNEAWEGGEAPKPKKKVTRKKAPAKKQST